MAKLTVAANTGAMLYIDGKPYGTVSVGQPFSLNVPPGNHEILLVKEGYYSFISIFLMETGKTYDLNPYLTPIY